MKTILSFLFVGLYCFLAGGSAFILSGSPEAGAFVGALTFVGGVTFNPGNVLAIGILKKNLMGKQAGMPGTITPQGKIVTVNNNAGNRGIARMQGSTRVIYDSLPVSGGQTVLRFFQGAGNRQFPFTNMDAENGKMGVGESMVVKYIHLFLFQLNEDGEVDSFTPLWNVPEVLTGEIEIVQGNQTILKRSSLANMFGAFNKNAQFEEYSVMELETDLVLMPQIEFTVQIRLAGSLADLPLAYVRCTLEGPASILNLQQNV